MKRRVHLGGGLDPQKLADTIQQLSDSFAQQPGLSVDAHDVDDGWLRLVPQPGRDAGGNPTRVVGWLLTFGYPHAEDPRNKLAGLKTITTEGVKLAGWEAGLYASYWLPPSMPSDQIAALAIAIVHKVQAVPEDAHVGIALEYGL